MNNQSSTSMPVNSKYLFQDKVVANDRDTFGPAGTISKADALAFANRLAAFKNWKSKLETNFGPGFKQIKLLEVYPFGPAKTATRGFVMADAIVEKGGKPVSGFAFIRGGAVAVLPILENEAGEKYVLTLLQPRVPGAEKDYEEIPAGMLDGGAFGGVAAKEMEEETGLKIRETDLTPLSLMYPSIGGCDENIKVFLYRAKISDAAMEELKGKATGNPDENEMIITKVTPYEEFKRSCLTSQISDVKAQVALGMYEMMKSEDKDMEGNPWKPVVNTMSGGYHKGKKHTRKHKAKRHTTRKH